MTKAMKNAGLRQGSLQRMTTGEFDALSRKKREKKKRLKKKRKIRKFVSNRD